MQMSRDTADRSIIVVMALRGDRFFAKSHVFIRRSHVSPPLQQVVAPGCRLISIGRNYARGESIGCARCVALRRKKRVEKGHVCPTSDRNVNVRAKLIAEWRAS